MKCSHSRVRCIHGDEIIATIRALRKPPLARVRCLECSRAIYKMELPEVCFYTGAPHYGWKDRNELGDNYE